MCVSKMIKFKWNGKNKKHSIKRSNIIVLILMLSVIVSVYLSIRTNDYYHITMTEFNYSGSDLDLQGKQGSSDDNGLYATGGDLYNLYNGKYSVDLDYSGDCQGYFNVVDIENNNEILGTGQLTDNSGTSTADFLISQETLHIQIQIVINQGEPEFSQLYFHSHGQVFSDRFWVIAWICILFILLWYSFLKYQKGKNKYLLVIVAACLVTSLPFMTQHLIYGDDILFHLSRIEGIRVGLRNGQFPVRINSVVLNGAGAITPEMYPDAFLYIPGAMCALGSSPLLAFKMLCILITFATGLVSYFSMRKMFSDRVALIFSLLYLFNPYRMNNLFVRADMGESLAMVFIPLVAVGVWQLCQDNYKRSVISLTVGVTGLLQSHIISLFIVFVFCLIYFVLYIILNFKKFFSDQRRIKSLLLSVLLIMLKFQ